MAQTALQFNRNVPGNVLNLGKAEVKSTIKVPTQVSLKVKQGLSEHQSH